MQDMEGGNKLATAYQRQAACSSLQSPYVFVDSASVPCLYLACSILPFISFVLLALIAFLNNVLLICCLRLLMFDHSSRCFLAIKALSGLLLAQGVFRWKTGAP